MDWKRQVAVTKAAQWEADGAPDDVSRWTSLSVKSTYVHFRANFFLRIVAGTFSYYVATVSRTSSLRRPSRQLRHPRAHVRARPLPRRGPRRLAQAARDERQLPREQDGDQRADAGVWKMQADGVKVWSVSPGFLATGLGGSPEKLIQMGAKDPGVGGRRVASVVLGERDADVGKVILKL
ncbi:hypothetical protein K438DRAFT_1953691 [Mycena galopus ATCC 62051]|nr:hypothetical protein K438DRAFT_1953691 [Mycena galopus ATCC 62051]